jgi:hypothetical protein
MVQVFAGGNKSAFGRKADIQASVLAGLVGGRMSNPSFDMMQRLLTAFPQVQGQWLVMGQGNMLKPEFDPETLMKYLELAEVALRRPGVFITYADARAVLNRLESIRNELNALQPAADAIEQGVYPAYEKSQVEHYRHLLSGVEAQISAVAEAESELREAEKTRNPSLSACGQGPKQFIELTDERGQSILVALSAISNIYCKDVPNIVIIELKTQGEKSNLVLKVKERYEDIKKMVLA